MASLKTRAALAGGKYLVTHPRGRLTRFVVRFAVRRVGKKLVSASHTSALPKSRAIRIVVLGWIVIVLSGTGLIAFVVRRRRRRAAATLARMPQPVTPTPVSSVSPTPPAEPTGPAAEAGAITAADAEAGKAGDGDEALVARVTAELSGGTTSPADLSVESDSGVITLRGSVPDEGAEVRVIRDAELVDGVKAVRSELQTASAEPGAPDA